jgi:hypothetical protein
VAIAGGNTALIRPSATFSQREKGLMNLRPSEFARALSLWERVAEGRVRAAYPVARYFALASDWMPVFTPTRGSMNLARLVPFWITEA